MHLTKWLQELQFDTADIAEILEKDDLYGKDISVLAENYMCGRQENVLGHVTQAEQVVVKEATLSYLEKAQQLAQTENDIYMLRLLFWLHCIPYLEQDYLRLGIEKEVLVDSLKDLVYKTRECKKYNDQCGVTTDWFYLFFWCKMFALGRLQYQTSVYEKEIYTYGDYVLSPGDSVFKCHIPSSGKLTPELCMESLDRAYRFFEKDLKDGILPVCCASWLLFPNYTEKVYGEGSNLKAFSQLFDVVSMIETESFNNAQTVFGMSNWDSLDELPQDTSLQRNFVSYIKSGGNFGRGYGILLYDGIKKEIINRR